VILLQRRDRRGAGEPLSIRRIRSDGIAAAGFPERAEGNAGRHDQLHVEQALAPRDADDRVVTDHGVELHAVDLAAGEAAAGPHADHRRARVQELRDSIRG
jgi:hypothetical protein